MQTKKEILKQAMNKRYCGETYFDFLDEEEIPLILKAMGNYSKQCLEQKNGWIDAIKEQPELIENEDYSPNVLAICNGQLMVMCYCYNPSEDESENGFFWSNCNGQIDGDAEFDDEYDVTHWQYLPSIVGFVA